MPNQPKRSQPRTVLTTRFAVGYCRCCRVIFGLPRRTKSLEAPHAGPLWCPACGCQLRRHCGTAGDADNSQEERPPAAARPPNRHARRLRPRFTPLRSRKTAFRGRTQARKPQSGKHLAPAAGKPAEHTVGWQEWGPTRVLPRPQATKEPLKCLMPCPRCSTN